MSWRKLAQLIRWLPKDAALYQSMRLARPPAPATSTGSERLVVDDPLLAMQHGHLEDLLLALLNRQEMRDYADSDPKTRGDFAPTLPPGYKRTTDAGDIDAQVAAYFAGMQPPTTDD